MLTPRHYTILDEIEQIQKQRQKNWTHPDGPEDEDLELTHNAKLDRLKAEIAKLNADQP